MKDSFFYPIIFMLIIVIIFVGVLAVAFRFSEQKIEDYQRDEYQKKVLKLVVNELALHSGISVETLLADYPQSFDNYLQHLELPNLQSDAYAAVVDGETVAYCFEIKGNGLWGSMRALVAFDTSFRTILDFDLVDQMETPGLGARIEEDWFLAQFRNRLFIVNPDAELKTENYEFIDENKEPEAGQLKRVTGATISSNAALNMLKNEISSIYDYYQESAP